MDIKELNKTQLILLSLLLTFVVSIATGIVTVSLMQQAPKSVPQTINNVIQRTIEKVTTVEVPAESGISNVVNNNEEDKNNIISSFGDGDALVSLYITKEGNESDSDEDRVSVGQGVIISEVGLILVNSNILDTEKSYVVSLSDVDYPVSILKNFGNGFSVMKISNNQSSTENNNDSTVDTTLEDTSNQ